MDLLHWKSSWQKRETARVHEIDFGLVLSTVVQEVQMTLAGVSVIVPRDRGLPTTTLRGGKGKRKEECEILH